MENDMPVGSGGPEHWHPHPTRPTRPASAAMPAPVGASAIETSMTVGEHEAASQHRYDKLCHKLKKVKEEIMSTPEVNVYQKDPMSGVMPLLMGGGYGGGAGGGALGGAGGGFAGAALGSLLLGNGGLLGNRGAAVADGGIVTPALLAASLAQVTDTAQNTTVLQTLGAIQGSIPLAEGQVQLAIAGAVGEIRSHLGSVENGLVAGQMAINKNVSDAIAASLASQNNLNVNILQSAAATRDAVTTYGVANLSATKDSQYATGVAIANSTKEILAAINAQDIANLQRQLTVAETALLERNATLRGRESEINVTQTVNQNQAQAQQQQQQQQQAILLNGIWSRLDGMQNAIATNSNMIIGNSGATATGPQTSNPVNVRT